MIPSKSKIGWHSLLTFVLSAILCLFSTSVQALEISVEPASPVICEHGTVQLDIYADSSISLISMGVKVSFAPGVLNVVDAHKNTDYINGFIMDEDGDPGTTYDQYSHPPVEIDNSSGSVTMLGGRFIGSSTTGLSGKVLMGSIVFEAVAVGSSDISIDLGRYHPDHPIETFDNFVNIDGSVDEPTNLGIISSITVLSDQDGDSLPDIYETGIYGTNPLLADTDGDNIDDGDELAAWNAMDCSGLGCADCWNCDIDGDGQANNLLDPDADGDGLLDGDEFLAGYNPADPNVPGRSKSMPWIPLLLLDV